MLASEDQWSPADVFYGPMRWSEKVGRLSGLLKAEPSEEAERYLALARRAERFTWEPGDFEILGSDNSWQPTGDPEQKPYGVMVREQAGALQLIEELEAMYEIVGTIVEHCEEHRPDPPYQPKKIQERLRAAGWLTEQRVPPPSADPDLDPRVNDKYDALKFFPHGDPKVGIGIEIERWEINNDLIKFWRGFTRGQIAAGVIIQDNPATLGYCFEHVRRLTEPLFGNIPILFLAPRGPGLPEYVKKPLNYPPFLMPS